MIDNVFANIIDYLRILPNILVTFINIIFSGVIILFIKKYFSYLGLGCYMVFLTIIGNIQILYTTYYEIIHMPVFLGTVALSSSFLVTDFINEFYGKNKAKNVIFLTFLIQVIFLINIILTIGHKPLVSENFSISQTIIDENIDSIAKVFLPIPRILIASYTAFLFSQLFEIWSYKTIKKIKFIKSNCLLHNISLFCSSVIVDTLTFTTIAFVLFSNNPLSFKDLYNISSSAIIIRILCNFINSLFLKLELKLIKHKTVL